MNLVIKGMCYWGGSNPDSLQHWKYFRKYRKNGHWVYVYKKPSELRKDLDKSYQDLKTIGSTLNRTVSKRDETYSKWVAEADSKKRKKYSKEYSDYEQAYVNQANSYIYAREKYNRMSTEYSEYTKSIYGKADRFGEKVDAGKKAVSNFLSKLLSRIFK